MRITAVTPFILHVPVTGSMIQDSTHTISHWGVVGAQIDTDAGFSGFALGEQLYTPDAFAEFFAQQAIHWAQPDVTRMAGITDVLQVCDTAHSFRIPVAPHAGDMSQVHVHLAHAHPAVAVLEYIPWIKDCFIEPAEVVAGHFRLPQEPGAGTTPTAAAWARFRRPAA